MVTLFNSRWKSRQKNKMAGARAAVVEKLQSILPPEASRLADGRDIVALGLIPDIFIADGKAFFALSIPADEANLWENTRKQAEAAAQTAEGVKQARASLTNKDTAEDISPRASASPPPPAATAEQAAPAALKPPRPAPAPKQPIPGVKHIIAIASGKGGVGKSTMAVNIAAALAQAGLKIGVMDADVYGPSLAKMTGIRKEHGQDIVRFQDKKLLPLEKFGLKLMSMGFLTDEGAPLVWRGPMVMTAVNQLLHDVLWAPLDVLIVDMPPGTGDAQLTLAQKVPLSGAIIVSTPQELALIDARKGLEMFHKIHVPILGIIENMSYFIAPDTGRHYAIFGGLSEDGKGGAEREAIKRNAPFLGALPLDPNIGLAGDDGEPLPIADKDSPLAKIYRNIAAALIKELNLNNR